MIVYAVVFICCSERVRALSPQTGLTTRRGPSCRERRQLDCFSQHGCRAVYLAESV